MIRDKKKILHLIEEEVSGFLVVRLFYFIGHTVIYIIHLLVRESTTKKLSSSSNFALGGGLKFSLRGEMLALGFNY